MEMGSFQLHARDIYQGLWGVCTYMNSVSDAAPDKNKCTPSLETNLVSNYGFLFRRDC